MLKYNYLAMYPVTSFLRTSSSVKNIDILAYTLFKLFSLIKSEIVKDLLSIPKIGTKNLSLHIYLACKFSMKQIKFFSFLANR